MGEGWAEDIAALVLGHDTVLGLGRDPLHRLPVPVQLCFAGGQRLGRHRLEGIILVILERLPTSNFIQVKTSTFQSNRDQAFNFQIARHVRMHARRLVLRVPGLSNAERSKTPIFVTRMPSSHPPPVAPFFPACNIRTVKKGEHLQARQMYLCKLLWCGGSLGIVLGAAAADQFCRLVQLSVDDMAPLALPYINLPRTCRSGHSIVRQCRSCSQKALKSFSCMYIHSPPLAQSMWHSCSKSASSGRKQR